MQQNDDKLTKCDNFGYIVGQTRHKWQLNSDKLDDHGSYMTAKHVDKNGDKFVSVAM